MDKTTKALCKQLMEEKAPRSIAWSHYDLAIETELDEIDTWREYLQEPDVMEWLQKERHLLQQSELAKLSTHMDNTQSVGRAQLLTSMMKVTEANKITSNDGPAYIYCYIPLSNEQRKAENVKELTSDIFKTDPNAKPINFMFND